MKFSREGNATARQLANEALALDPDFADAMIIVGFTHLIDARTGYSNSREESLRLAIELSGRAKELAPEVPMLYNLKQSILRLEGKLDEAVKAGERAIELSPSTSVSLLATAMTTHFAGQFDRSIELAKRAMRHNPRYSSANLIWVGWSSWFKGDYQQATVAANEGLRRAESPAVAALHHLTLALIYAETGELEEARQAASKAREVFPRISVSFYRRGFPYKNAADQERLLGTLRKVGLPE
jgi:tetratricopeptide (TPR) repeat protein